MPKFLHDFVVGIDVASEFSFVAMLAPDGELIRKFKGNRMKMSKRGTKLGRRTLYTIAMASIRKTRKGDAINPILKAYYEAKILSKKKKVALVAVMHKLLHFIFAVLRDQKPCVFRKPEEHRSLLLMKLTTAA